LARRHSPDTLAAPFDGHFQSRSLKVIPEAGNPDLEQLIAQQSALIRQVAPLWQTEQDAILDQLVRSNLSRTSYKPERVEAAAQQLDQEFKAGHFLNGCTCLLLFTPDKIRSAARKDSHLPDHPFFDLCSRLHAVAQQIEEACQEKLLYHQRALGEWLRDELERRKQALNLRSYDDLLLDLHRALEGAGGERLAAGLRQRYRAALIDEFQDTDPLQWRIFELLAGEGGQSGNALAASPQPELSFGTQWDPAGGLPLFLIGDPKQAIYSFRGADIHAYLSAARSIDRARRWTLGTNRRSSKLLVDGVSALFRRENPFLDHAITYGAVSSGRAADQQLLRHGTPVTAPLRFWVYRRETPARAAARGAARSAAVAATAAEIAHLLDGSYELVTKQGIRRALRPGDVAVLVKAHYQAELVQQALQDLSVPSVQHGDATIFETAEALDLLRILRAAAEPFRSDLVREALLTGIIGLTADEVHALDRDDSAWDAWILRFRSLQEAMGSGGIMELAAQLLGECGVRRQVLTHERGERRMTNILHCLDLLHQAERLQGIGLESSIVWLERRISGQEQDETYLLRLETDENAVTISTIHASKGLEYPVVFIPFAWEPPPARNGRVLFHDEQGERVLDLGSDRYEENKRTAGAEQDAEAARLLYVALTRAEFLCYLSWGCI
ncbi:MAG TPA: UvrD-helicase domain-containing protein, partial [Geothrix sp.]|nr:UvrD-helicase domain-containing protein [Geothrix sp.]